MHTHARTQGCGSKVVGQEKIKFKKIRSRKFHTPQTQIKPLQAVFTLASVRA